MRHRTSQNPDPAASKRATRVQAAGQVPAAIRAKSLKPKAGGAVEVTCDAAGDRVLEPETCRLSAAWPPDGWPSRRSTTAGFAACVPHVASVFKNDVRHIFDFRVAACVQRTGRSTQRLRSPWSMGPIRSSSRTKTSEMALKAFSNRS